MNSILTVQTPAVDRSLLSLSDLRTATRSTTASDADLMDLGDEVASAIARYCKVAQAGATPVTMREETLVEVFRDVSCAAEIVLARWPLVSVTSITEDSVALTASDYEPDAAPGFLYRLASDTRVEWSTAKTTVVYVAGWATVPEDLKLAAKKLASFYWSQQVRDPLIRGITIPDVIEKQFWVGDSTKGRGIPEDVANLLRPFSDRR